jgi:glutathione S-transferase
MLPIYTAWVTLAALIVYLWTGINVARARIAFKVPAPQMEGPVPFMSVLRVQANTLEQLPMLLVPLWMCALYLDDRWAAGLGAVWCVGRVVYALGYYKDPGKRELGFTMAISASGLLILAAAIGIWRH